MCIRVGQKKIKKIINVIECCIKMYKINSSDGWRVQFEIVMATDFRDVNRDIGHFQVKYINQYLLRLRMYDVLTRPHLINDIHGNLNLKYLLNT